MLVAELGWSNALLYGAHRLCERFGGAVAVVRYHLVAQPVPDKPLLPRRLGRSIEVRRITTDDPVVRSMPLTPGELHARKVHGDTCLAAFKDDRLIGHLWLRFGAYEESEARCRFVPLPEGTTPWDFDLYVAPEERGSLAFVRLWDEANAYLRSRGVNWTMSRISAFSPNSLAAHARLAAQRLGGALFIRIGGWQITLASLRPYVHLSTGPNVRPEFRLSPPGPGLDDV